MLNKEILFSVKHEDNHLVCNLFGIKFKTKYFVSKKKYKTKNINKLFYLLKDETVNIEDLKINYLSKLFYEEVGYFPNFKTPKSFNEKLNWIRFNFRDLEPDYICNKLSFKQYVEKKLGSGYTAKLLKVFDDIADLNFDGLPDKFVVKTTYGFGAKAVKIIKNKNEANLDLIKFELSETMNPWNYTTEQWFFRKNAPNFKVFVEEYIENSNEQLNDYKIMCFHDEPKMIIAICDREHDKYSIAYYDTNWNKLNVIKAGYKNKDVPKPENLDKMLEIAKTLSNGFPFVRVDLYNVEGKILAGEMTFIPAGAVSKFEPIEWDYKIGEWLDLGKIDSKYLNILPEFQSAAKKFIKNKEFNN